VRVWWPPTIDPAKTGFSGAYWPARVVAGPAGGAPGADWATVKYDNGERGRALVDDLFPASPPVPFGGEADPIKPGEFVEVHNGSASDPCAWLAVARRVARGEAVVAYPFHDSGEEEVPLGRVRRARVWEGGAWQLPRPGQRWQPGDVTSPRELELLGEREYNRARQHGKAGQGQQKEQQNGGGGVKGGKGKVVAAKKPAAKKAPVAAAAKKKKPAAAAAAPKKQNKAAAVKAKPRVKAKPPAKAKPKAKPAAQKPKPKAKAAAAGKKKQPAPSKRK
jgi:hypothetical protein